MEYVLSLHSTYVGGMSATSLGAPLIFLSINPNQSKSVEVAVGKIIQVIPIVGSGPGVSMIGARTIPSPIDSH